MRKILHDALRVVLVFTILLMLAPSASARSTVALVLGGGAARGFSHVGLLKAFEEEGIPVDMIVAASMGSVLSGLYASGFSIAELEYMAQRVDLAELFSVTLPPKGGVVNTQRLERFLHELTGGARFEDLRIPYYTVVTNLFTGESVVLREGSLSRAIVASMSIPGMFPPVEIDGEIYVDGGIKDPVPARFARELGADIVIAVDVRRELENPNRASIVNNLQLTLYFLMDQNTELHMGYVDVLVSPDVHFDTYMDYQRAAYFMEKGYQAAKAAMPEIKAALLQKDPGITFNPRFDPNDRDEALDRRLDAALAAARPPAESARLLLRPAWTFEEGEAPRFDLEARLPFLTGERSALVGGYSLSRRFGEEGVHTLKLGKAVGAGAAFAFLRRAPSEGAWRPGLGLDLTWNRPSRGGGSLEAEWERREGESAPPQWKVAVSDIQPLGGPIRSRDGVAVERELTLTAGQDARGIHASEEPYLDARTRLYFPLRRGVLSELAILQPTAYIGLGTHVDWADDRAKASWIGEAGLRLETRFFGLYPLRSRISFAYYGEKDRWVLSFLIGA